MDRNGMHRLSGRLETKNRVVTGVVSVYKMVGARDRV